MGKDTGIPWCHHTFNPWIGCSPVSPGCDNCYARALAARWGSPAEWKDRGVRTVLSEDYWRQPYRWNKAALAAGTRPRVFCGSMCDIFEPHPSRVVSSERWGLAMLINVTECLDWLLLTKRPEAIPSVWREKWPTNAWIGVTAEEQRYLDERFPHVVNIPAPVRFVSYEPAIGPLHSIPDGVDWLICGGESGGRARKFELDWARNALELCRARGVAFFLKQLGRRPQKVSPPSYGHGPFVLSQIDGRDPAEWPEDLRVQEFPVPKRR